MACTQPTNYQCRTPRTAKFTRGDIAGQWQLTTARGESCELVLHGGSMLTASCLPLGEPVTRLSSTKFEASELRFLDKDDNPLLAFDTANPDDLKGLGASHGYRLVRLEPATFSPPMWEGRWEMQNSHNNTTCQLILSMRNRQLEGQAVWVRVPHGITLMSGCVSPVNEGMFREPLTEGPGSRITRTDGGRRTITVSSRRIPLPVWTSWRTDVSDIVFRNDSGSETVFKIQDDFKWRAQIDVDDKQLVLTLQRKRD